jgi:MinD-like ATPase involved in chromosome partitioning or flagellar assembly
VEGTETGWGRPAEPAPRWRALLDRALLGSRTGEQPTVTDQGEAEAGPARRESRYSELLPADPVPGTVAPRTTDPLGADAPVAGPWGADPPGAGPRTAQALPSRPVNPLDHRHRNPLDQRPIPIEPRPAEPRRQVAEQRSEPRLANPLQRPVNPLDRRRAGRDPRGDAPDRGNGAELRSAMPPERPLNPLERPVNPLEPRRQARPGEGLHGRAESAGDQPHSFFNPATRAVQAPITRVTQDNGYPPARAAASVGSAAVKPPPAPAQVPIQATIAPAQTTRAPIAPTAQVPATHAPAPAPAADAPARIEWHQARPEQDLERAVAVLRRKLGRPRVLAFANPKGGVHKTTATVLAAATIGSVRGRGVLAWDDNELRGTLGLRAGSARHARTIRHLVSDLIQIENLHGDDLIDRLDDYLRHASDGSYDVLAGEENPRFAQRLDQPTVARVMDLLRRTHDVICVDTGNNVESVNWQTVMKAADQLVVTTVPREDAAFTADWMLDLLEDTGMQDLVANAVTLISCPSAGRLPLLDDFSKHFATRTRAVAVVPYDPALEVGSSIEYSMLRPETRQAWLRAASVMIEPFAL